MSGSATVFRNSTKILISLILGICASVMTGCGGAVSISISPTSATVPPGHTQQFSASVKNGSSSVTWQVNSIIGGNSTYGTISTDGLYTAPASVPSTSTVTITAVPDADTMKTATATVTIANEITVSPASANVSVTATQQFSASVTFSSNTNVTWQVNGITGGNSTYGTIDTAGLYTAPSAVPSSPWVTITAVSKADSTKTATAAVQILPPSIVISPTSATLTAGSQQGFTATVLQQSVTPSWSVQCQSSTSTDCGSINADGIYTAPLQPPPGGTAVITASMPDGGVLSSHVTVTIQASNPSLFGNYVFEIGNSAGSAFSAEVGTVGFDGVGGITGGELDRAGVSGGPIAITGGSYSIGIDGRGTALLDTDQGYIYWQLAVANNSTAYIVRLNADGNPSTGTLDLQQQSATFSNAAQYALNLAGYSSSGTPLALAGSVTTSGQGTISRALLDVASGSSVQTNVAGTGSFSAPSTYARGTLSIVSAVGTQTFVYYAVDSTRVKLIETDSSNSTVGELFQQSAGPFSASSFNENLAFTLSGPTSAGTYAIGGLFTLDGNSGITNMLLDGVNQTVFDTPGVYLITDSVSGRTTATWTLSDGSVLKYVLYPRSDGGFAMLEIDGNHFAQGVALRRTVTTPNSTTLAGSLAIALSGTDATIPSPTASTGNIVVTSAGVMSGTLDSADTTGSTLGAVLQIGSYSIATTGRGVFTVLSSSPALNGSVMNLYVVDANRVLVLESDSKRVLTGTMTRQY